MKKGIPEKESQNIEELMLLYQANKDEKKRRALHIKIVKSGMDLVKRLASPISKQTGVLFEDLVQVGALGLIKAIKSFTADKNAKFSTYATYYIKGEIRHYIRDKVALIKTPRKVHELIIKVYNATKELKAEGIEEPSSQDIAKHINISPENVDEILKLEKHKFLISLDQATNLDEEDSTLLDRIPDGDYQESERLYENKLLIESAITKLPEELREIIELSFFAEKSQREIAEEMNISQMQVSRRMKKALNKMYEILEGISYDKL